MGFVLVILGGVVSGAVSVLLPSLLGGASGWSLRAFRWLGGVRLAYLRTGAAAVFGLAAPTALSLSTSNEHHRPVTYLAWYGAALAGLVAAIGLTILIDRRSIAAKEQAVEPVFGAVEGEIALAHEEAAELRKLLGDEWPHLTPEGAALEEAIADWRAKTGVFIEVALGSAHRAAFRTAARGDALDCIEAEAKCLSDLGQRLKPSMVRVDEGWFLQARKARRENKAARYLSHEHHRAPYAPPPALEPPPSQFGRRDDKCELAKRCHMLAGSVEGWVEAFRKGQSERAEKFVGEWLEADPAIDTAKARQKAHTRDEKLWENDYRRKYGGEAREVFEKAWRMGEVAKEHEQLAAAPLAVQFAEVPELFNEIADRLYGDS